MSKYSKNALLLVLELWSYIGIKRKIQFYGILILTIFTSFAEIISLGALLPFLAALTDPIGLYQKTWMRPILNILNINSSQEMILPLTIIFVIAAITAGIMRLIQSWANIRASYATGADLSLNLYERTLYQPYSLHVSRNSSSIINAVSIKTMSVVSGGILPMITIITSVVVLLSIMTTLIIIDPNVALSVFIGFAIVYTLIISFTRNKLKINSILIANESNHLVKSLQEGLGGIRDVLIDGNQEVYKNIFKRAVYPLRLAQANNLFIAQSPRFIIEAIGITLIAIIAYLLAHESGSLLNSIPILGALAFGAQRMLPIFQLVYASFSTLLGNTASFNDVLELLDQPMPEKEELKGIPIVFSDKIELNNIHFSYNHDGPEILSGIDLIIKKGSKVGIIGSTGCGKSTLLDIIMSLLLPSKGKVLVDGKTIGLNNLKGWQKNIAHVPQTIFLSDSSIEENIAFGISLSNIDNKRVKWAAKQAQIDDIIDSWPKGYKTVIGERGIRLSGGQRQRIGIARALYKSAKVIIFDEATSALDNNTEIEIIKSIEALQKDLTIIIVAHRLTSLKNCEMIVEIEKGNIKRLGSYDKIVR